ncbi:hypothetical protein WJX73_003882 [Symbiochloris irregularis]|uniref:Uncharacterized protein n=1 Tax=Symbiochloris irregularis TaxID=706552 RepID=A0AAW1NX59_9CHLO
MQSSGPSTWGKLTLVLDAAVPPVRPVQEERLSTHQLQLLQAIAQDYFQHAYLWLARHHQAISCLHVWHRDMQLHLYLQRTKEVLRTLRLPEVQLSLNRAVVGLRLDVTEGQQLAADDFEALRSMSRLQCLHLRGSGIGLQW